jgi:hypothetical protein
MDNSLTGRSVGLGRDGSLARQSLWGAAGPGLIIAAIAILALFNARGLTVGTAEHVGPGAAVDAIATLLLILGIIMSAQALVRRRSGGRGSWT